MSWGHAVSHDLVHWTELPIAMAERWNMAIYSGSAVVDWQNTSGLAKGTAPPLIAAYTGHHRFTDEERQYLAFSHDRGRTWRQHPQNPVLDEASKDFRDPKVFWHEETSRWVMAVCFALKREIAIYSSPDLVSWTQRSVFVPPELRDGTLEVPELLRVPVEGGGSRWVMTYFFKGAALDSGSGGRYFVGDFDGERFTPARAAQPDGSAVIDYGGDFYAAQTWSDLPATDGRVVWIAWMANVQYAHATPTHPWRGALTIPRALSLHAREGEHRLRQRPIAELEALRREQVEARDLPLGQAPIALPLPPKHAGAVELWVTLAIGHGSKMALALRYGTQVFLIEYDAVAQALSIDRMRAGQPFAPAEANRRSAPVALDDGRLSLHLFVDRGSVELFASNSPAPNLTRLLLSRRARSIIKIHGASSKCTRWPN
jgi:fructan beta-fructosidase